MFLLSLISPRVAPSIKTHLFLGGGGQWAWGWEKWQISLIVSTIKKIIKIIIKAMASVA